MSSSRQPPARAAGKGGTPSGTRPVAPSPRRVSITSSEDLSYSTSEELDESDDYFSYQKGKSIASGGAGAAGGSAGSGISSRASTASYSGVNPSGRSPYQFPPPSKQLLRQNHRPNYGSNYGSGYGSGYGYSYHNDREGEGDGENEDYDDGDVEEYDDEDDRAGHGTIKANMLPSHSIGADTSSSSDNNSSSARFKGKIKHSSSNSSSTIKRDKSSNTLKSGSSSQSSPSKRYSRSSRHKKQLSNGTIRASDSGTQQDAKNDDNDTTADDNDGDTTISNLRISKDKQKNVDDKDGETTVHDKNTTGTAASSGTGASGKTKGGSANPSVNTSSLTSGTTNTASAASTAPSTASTATTTTTTDSSILASSGDLPSSKSGKEQTGSASTENNSAVASRTGDNKIGSGPATATILPSSTSAPNIPVAMAMSGASVTAPPTSTITGAGSGLGINSGITPSSVNLPAKASGSAASIKKPNTMTVEAETVEAVPTIAVAPTIAGSGSLKVKKSTDNVMKPINRTKKKKSSRLGQGSKAEIFAAKIASAVDEVHSSDSDETFVYESNPPDRSDSQRQHHQPLSSSQQSAVPSRPRFQSRNPSTSSLPFTGSQQQLQLQQLQQQIQAQQQQIHQNYREQTQHQLLQQQYQEQQQQQQHSQTLQQQLPQQTQQSQQQTQPTQQTQQLTGQTQPGTSQPTTTGAPSLQQTALGLAISSVPGSSSTQGSSVEPSGNVAQMNRWVVSKHKRTSGDTPMSSSSSITNVPVLESNSGGATGTTGGSTSGGTTAGGSGSVGAGTFLIARDRDTRSNGSSKRSRGAGGSSRAESPRPEDFESPKFYTHSGPSHSPLPRKLTANRHYDSTASYKAKDATLRRWRGGGSYMAEEDDDYDDQPEQDDMDDDIEYLNVSETTPLRSSGHSIRRSRKAGSLVAYSPHNYQHGKSWSQFYYFRIMFWAAVFGVCVLATGFILGFLLATSKPLQETRVSQIFDVLVSDEVLAFEVVIEAYNPGYLGIEVQNVNLDLFAKSKHVTDLQRETTTSTKPDDDESHTMLLGNVQKFDVPLIFEGGIFSKRLQKAVGDVKLVNPGRNTTGDDLVKESLAVLPPSPSMWQLLQQALKEQNGELDEGQKKWSRVNVHSFDLILRGSLKYKLLFGRERSVSIAKVSPPPSVPPAAGAPPQTPLLLSLRSSRHVHGPCLLRSRSNQGLGRSPSRRRQSPSRQN
ncbi:Vac7p [Sugiyamaella lignohabitans]|uniref:Vac7p n=1 Tax=Sugiyamaella lignohabitans TaxID=796027 RepID=A0A167E724_9ASCO|nr:Vac7p [Sugiyamaella lignohabitans]ANB13722.1 Vac7p [Sugiyamaella lignohabitans]